MSPGNQEFGSVEYKMSRFFPQNILMYTLLLLKSGCCGLCPQVGWSTARDYYTFLWSPMPENYEPGSTVHRTVVFQGTHTHTHSHTAYANHYTDPGYSKVTPPFYGVYKNHHFYLIRLHNRKRQAGTSAPLKPYTFTQVEGLQTRFTGPGTVRYYTVKI